MLMERGRSEGLQDDCLLTLCNCSFAVRTDGKAAERDGMLALGRDGNLAEPGVVAASAHLAVNPAAGVDIEPLFAVHLNQVERGFVAVSPYQDAWGEVVGFDYLHGDVVAAGGNESGEEGFCQLGLDVGSQASATALPAVVVALFQIVDAVEEFAGVVGIIFEMIGSGHAVGVCGNIFVSEECTHGCPAHVVGDVVEDALAVACFHLAVTVQFGNEIAWRQDAALDAVNTILAQIGGVHDVVAVAVLDVEEVGGSVFAHPVDALGTCLEEKPRQHRGKVLGSHLHVVVAGNIDQLYATVSQGLEFVENATVGVDYRAEKIPFRQDVALLVGKGGVGGGSHPFVDDVAGQYQFVAEFVVFDVVEECHQSVLHRDVPAVAFVDGAFVAEVDVADDDVGP